MAAPKLPQRFGPYTLQELIARGGMAEIFRATTSGVGGFEKTVAIKKILPHLAENDEYMTMLIDEARIIVSINHANIAQVYDLGEIDGDYYIAMEYIHGIDLSTMVKELKEAERTVPVEHALFIASGIAAGLHVAHNKCDDTGRPNNIVHRDVSPHNILISFAGDVKIIDFGVAKARGKEAHTQLGVIKGKLLYMAPEQAMAKELDGRADLFAMGLILYRMLTNHLPFEGDNEFQIYNNILSKEIPPPRAFNPNIPEEVNQITMMLLQRDPSKRYQDGYSAKVDLDRALQAVAPGYSISRLSRWVESDFSHLIEKRQRAQSGQNHFAPSTPSHNQVHTGQMNPGFAGPPQRQQIDPSAPIDWEPDWDVIDESEDTVNVSMDSPEAVAVMRQAEMERQQFESLRASGGLPAPAQAPWGNDPPVPHAQPQAQVPQPQQSGQWNQPPGPYGSQQASIPPQFAGSGQWPAAQNPYGSGQFASPSQSGQFHQPLNPSGVFPMPGQYPGQSGQFQAAPPVQQSGIYANPNPAGGFQSPMGSGQFQSPSQSGVFQGHNPSGYYASPGNSGIYGSPHYEPFQPGADAPPQAEEAPKSRILPAVGVLLILCVIVGMLAWKLYASSPEESGEGMVGATTQGGELAADGTTGIDEVPEVVEAVGAEVDSGAPTPEVEVRKVSLRVDTTPKGASVFIGEDLLGTTPLEEPIPWGEKEVMLRFELEGYETHEMEAIPFDDVRRKVDLTPLAGTEPAEPVEPDAGTAKVEEKQEAAPPPPKKKKRTTKRRKPRPKTTTKDPAVPLLLDDKPKPKSDVPVF